MYLESVLDSPPNLLLCFSTTQEKCGQTGSDNEPHFSGGWSSLCGQTICHQLHKRHGYKLENERLPLGSLGTTAGWVMKRKQHVKRFPKLPERCSSRVCD